MTAARRLALVAAALLLAGATAALAFFPGLGALQRHPEAWFLGLAALAAAAFVPLALFAWSEPGTGAPARGGTLATGAIVALALLMRGPALLSTPWLSDDVWRYLWEGRVQRAGCSPYALAPAAPELAALRDDVHARVTHREISAVYPPAAELLFRVVPEDVTVWKGCVVAADLALLLLLLRELRRRGLPARRALLYGAHPLVALEAAGSGHVDVFAWLPLLLALLWLADGARGRLRRFASGFASGLAALFKPQGLAAAADRLRQRDLLALGGVALALLLGFLPFARDGAALATGTLHYAHDWEFNGLVYPPCVRLAGALKSGLEALPTQPLHLWKVRELGYAIVPNQLGRKLSALVFAVAALWMMRRLRGRPLALTFGVLAAFVATAPAVHPWYVAWLVPFAPLLPRRAARAALLLALTTLAAYVVRIDALASGTWVEPAWLGPVTWAPPCLLAAFDARNAWRARSRPRGSDAAGAAVNSPPA